jgi:hypothetical protein
MLCNDFHVFEFTLNKCTSPFRFVFLPPMRMISLGLIARALHAQSGFYNELH